MEPIVSLKFTLRSIGKLEFFLRLANEPIHGKFNRTLLTFNLTSCVELVRKSSFPQQKDADSQPSGGQEICS